MSTLDTMDPFLRAYIEQAMEKENGGMAQQLALNNQLGPEGLRRQISLGTVDDRRALAGQESQAQQAMVARQLAQMQKFSEPQGRNYGSVAGNIVGGLGDIVRQVGGGIAAGKLQGQQQDMMTKAADAQRSFLSQQDQGRNEFASAQAEAIRQLMQQRAAQQQGPSAMGPPRSSGLGLTGLQWDPSLFGG